ncbi:MAG: hypothetical protein M5U26_26520 [Planctomycetota bacterium]|nr:hypothetical protein [Planctomycetota bacterium]
MPGKKSADDLLKHFDEDLAARLRRMVASGDLEAGHLEALIRLTSKSPEFRDEESLETALENATEMTAADFREWVDELLDDVK